MAKELTAINVHLLGAFWAWAEENGLRTHIRFATQAPGVIWHPKRKEPADVLSIGSNAVKNLVMDATGVSCRTRIQGMELDVFIPMCAIDFVFSPDVDTIAMPLPPMAAPSTPPSPSGPVTKARPKLSIVK